MLTFRLPIMTSEPAGCVAGTVAGGDVGRGLGFGWLTRATGNGVAGI